VIARSVYGIALDREIILIVAAVLFLLLPTLVITRIARGPEGLRALLRSMVHFKIRWQWYLLPLLLMPALTLASMLSAPPGGLSASALLLAYLTAYLPAVWSTRHQTHPLSAWCRSSTAAPGTPACPTCSSRSLPSLYHEAASSPATERPALQELSQLRIGTPNGTDEAAIRSWLISHEWLSTIDVGCPAGAGYCAASTNPHAQYTLTHWRSGNDYRPRPYTEQRGNSPAADRDRRHLLRSSWGPSSPPSDSSSQASRASWPSPLLDSAASGPSPHPTSATR
jgi:hypothetical protein